MFKRLIFPLSFLALGLAFFLWTATSPFWRALREVSGAMRLVHSEYVDQNSVSYSQLAELAIRGMVENLDPFSSYMNPEEFAQYESGTNQAYVGIGIEIEKVGNWVTVMRVFFDSPAERADIQPGYQVYQIEGENMEGATVSQVSERLRGQSGEAVEVSFRSPEGGAIFDKSLTRAPVAISSVEQTGPVVEGLGIIEISVFGKRTVEEFLSIEASMQEEGLSKLIIDLRDNPGGLLRTAKSLAGFYIPSGERVVELRGRNQELLEVFTAGGELSDRQYPIAVLVNESSASAAEIMAGVLQDSSRARIFGETTYGKGSVQSIYAFDNGSGLRQTTALYYLPSGRSIHETGVEPDELIPVSADERIRLLLQQRHARLLEEKAFIEAFGFEPNLRDSVLLAAENWLNAVVAAPVEER